MVENVEPAQHFAGVPDAFQRLWTPYRMAYIQGAARPTTGEAGECPFCRAPSGDDASGLIVHRGRLAYVVMNLFPYAPGHLLVCPYRHVAQYVELSAAETVEFAALTQAALRTLSAVSHPDGFNLGMNQGAVAGAGIAAHLHQHIVPRWAGDTNFLPIIAETKALPQLLEDGRRMLAENWVEVNHD
ncbi:MAG: HIT domain-containing protein [Propionibacteriaceae bacterium]|nr:HIT domain-containing protein [Propionibacteriaceae bacterium]